MSRATATDALGHIRSDLERVRRRRSFALACYVVVFALLVGGLLVAPPQAASIPRSASWMLTLGGLFLSSVLAASAAIGVPLWRERTMFIATAVAGLALGGALALIVDWRAPVTTGTKCFAYGAFVSAVAMIVLGALSGRVWRRFPDPGWLLAISVTGVGLTALHFACPATDALHVYAYHLGPVLLAYALARVALRARETLLREENL
jgi:hypothetical protein